MTRELPNAVDIERVVLGTMLEYPDLQEIGLGLLSEHHFYSDRHRLIFKFLKELKEKEEWVDSVIFVQRAREAGVLEKMGGVAYLTELEGMPESFEYYCQELDRKYRQRKGIILARRLEEGLKYSLEGSLEEIGRLQEVLCTNGKVSCLDEVVEKVKESVVAKVENPGLIGGIPTGWKDLDEVLDGLQGGKLYLIAGRPGMGKSSFMISMARNLAQRGIGVGIFSLEMSAYQIVEWMVSQRARVDIRKPRKKDLPALLSAAEEVKSYPLKIDDSSVSIGQIRSEAFLWRREGVEVMFLDHIQLVEDDVREAYQRMSEVSRKLKNLTKELGVPFVVLCQLSREIEKRGGDHRPRLSDLRDSGRLEENADVVIFIHRPEYYGISTNGKPPNYAAVIIEKQRDGALGTVDFLFIKEQRRFELLTREVE
ncbi:MAG: hypothetical protein DRJ44_08240 [Thermoprotei archaeon]|nr:MAG: hypothetical protein DRJ44_08240 [Thermoprotei archaeon]